MNSLPIDIIINEIFPHIYEESSHTLVCKDWHSILNSTDFIYQTLKRLNYDVTVESGLITKISAEIEVCSFTATNPDGIRRGGFCQRHKQYKLYDEYYQLEVKHGKVKFNHMDKFWNMWIPVDDYYFSVNGVYRITSSGYQRLDKSDVLVELEQYIWK